MGGPREEHLFYSTRISYTNRATVCDSPNGAIGLLKQKIPDYQHRLYQYNVYGAFAYVRGLVYFNGRVVGRDGVGGAGRAKCPLPGRRAMSPTRVEYAEWPHRLALRHLLAAHRCFNRWRLFRAARFEFGRQWWGGAGVFPNTCNTRPSSMGGFFGIYDAKQKSRRRRSLSIQKREIRPRRLFYTRDVSGLFWEIATCARQ